MFRLLDLPRDILLHLLLHHFTLQEVIQLRSLSHELYDLVHYCLGRRRSLKLFFYFSEVQAYTKLLYQHNLDLDPALRLHSPGPSSDELILNQHKFLNPVVDLLVDRLFPNVTHLILFFRDNVRRESIVDYARQWHLIKDNLTYMISRMSTRLTGLSLFGKIRGDLNGRILARRLLHLVNQYRNLRRLDLCVENLHLCSDNAQFGYMDQDEIVSLPGKPFLLLEPILLTKLERISVRFDYENNGLNFCKHSFRHLGPHLTHLDMHQSFGDMDLYIPKPLLCHALIGRTLSTSSITHLKLTQHLSTLLPKVLPRFVGLKSLDLVNSTCYNTKSGISLCELFGLLGQFCPQLTVLKLSEFTLGWVRVAEQSDLPQLEQIKHLAIKCIHEQYYYDPVIKPEDQNIPFNKFLTTFAYIMPNLERFNLKTEQDYFSDCDKILFETVPRLRTLSIGYYSGFKFTCHQLLSVQYRKRYIRECGEGWTELEKQYELYCKDLDGVWSKEEF